MNIQTSVFYVVGGSKGGVGKSLFPSPLVDYLLDRNANILLVDTDTDNPDVFKAHKELALPRSALPSETVWTMLTAGRICWTLCRTTRNMPWSSTPPPAPRPARPATATS